MKVLSIGTDRNLFDGKSAVLERQKEYAEKLDELHIIVFSLRSLGLKEVHYGNFHIYPTNSSGKLKFFKDAKIIGERILAGKTDFVITTQDPFETGIVGKKLKQEFNLPLQVQIHVDFLDPHFKNSILNRIRVLIAHRVIPEADGIRVVSQAIKDSIAKNFSKLRAEPKVLPIFVDTGKIINETPVKDAKKDFPQFEQFILMTSRLSKEKRIDTAFHAFKKVLDTFPKVGLIIAGDGSERPNLEVLAKNLQIAANVKFIGWQTNPISYMKTADIFLLTSEYEGYGMTLIEAGASSAAIVSTNVGIARELLKNGENSFVCRVGDIECLANSMIELLKNQEKRNLFKTNIKDSIEKISITKDEYIKRYIGLLEEIV